MTKPYGIQVEDRMGYTWIVLPGALNMDNCCRIEKEIEACLSGEKRQAVMDFSNIHYLFSTGIGLVIRIRKLVLEKGGMLWLVNVRDKCREIFVSMKLDKVVPLFSTDLAFEVSQENIWEKKLSQDESTFLCVSVIEEGVCAIVLSGAMVAMQDLSSCNTSRYRPDVSAYVFDLSSLDLIDSSGAHVLVTVIGEIRKHKAQCVCFGGNTAVVELLELLSINKDLPCFKDRKEALDALAQ